MLHKKKFLLSAITVCVALLFIALPASAHVTVNPATSTTEAWEIYSVKIPVEKDVDTNKIVIKIPDNVEFKMYEPVEGWNVTTQTDDSEKVSTVTWEADSEDTAIRAGEYRIFSFTAKNPSETGQVAWDAFQYYADGSIVEWTGDSDSELPHSITEIAQSEVTTDSHIHSSESAEEELDADSDEATITDGESVNNDNASSQTSMVLSIIAIVVSVIAIILTFVRKK